MAQLVASQILLWTFKLRTTLLVMHSRKKIEVKAWVCSLVFMVPMLVCEKLPLNLGTVEAKLIRYHVEQYYTTCCDLFGEGQYFYWGVSFEVEEK